MLQIECSHCKKQVNPNIIIDIREISCPECEAAIPASNVFIAAGPYNIQRDSLLKNLRRYRQLLVDAERELAELKTSDSKNAENAARNANKLVYHLKELFSGCPEHPRHRIVGDIKVGFRLNNKDYQGRLVNLSLSGACIGESKATFIIASNPVDITIPDPENEEIKLPGKVVWTTRRGLMGIQFTSVRNKERLKDYISRNSAHGKTRRTAQN